MDDDEGGVGNVDQDNANNANNANQGDANMENMLRRLMQAAAAPRGMKPPRLSSIDSESFLVWRRNFIDISALNEWNVHRSKVAARSSLEGEAASLCHSIPLGDNAFTLDMLLDAYENRIMSPAATTLAETLFESATQVPGETVNKWHSRLRNLYLRAFPEELANLENSRQLIKKFLNGLADPQIRLHAKAQNPENYTNCRNVSQAMEAVLLSEGKGGKGGVHSLGEPSNNAFHLPNVSSQTINAITSSKKCIFCERDNHVMKDCYTLGKVYKILEKIGLSESALKGSTRFQRNNNNSRRGQNRNRGGAGRVNAISNSVPVANDPLSLVEESEN